MSRLRYALALLPVLLLMSCDGSSTYRHWLRNTTDEPVHVRAEITASAMVIDTDIDAGEETVFSVFELIGGRPDPGLPTEWIMNMVVTNAAGDTLKTDVAMEASWGICSEQLRKVPSSYQHDFFLEVRAADF